MYVDDFMFVVIINYLDTYFNIPIVRTYVRKTSEHHRRIMIMALTKYKPGNNLKLYNM